MKRKLAVMIGCFFLSGLGVSGSLACRGGCMEASPPCPPTSPTCECADRACYSGNPCLSQSQCCEAFGNIGATSQSSPCGRY